MDDSPDVTRPDADAPPPAATMLSPVAEGQRFDSLDIVRGFAVLGILAMNIMTFAMPFAGYTNPTFMWPFEGANQWTYWIVHTLFDLKMMSLFSMLFGAGVVVYAAKTDREGVRRVRWLWLRRMFWLFLLGMVHAYLIWEGDILVAYAICGVAVLWWLRNLPVWGLLLVSGIFLVISLLLTLFNGWWIWMLTTPKGEEIMLEQWSMTAEQIEESREGTLAWMSPDADEIQRQIDVHRGGYATVFRERASMAMMIQFKAFPFFIFWRATSMMLLGAALMKLRFFSGERSVASYASTAIICYAIGLPLVIGGIVYNTSHGFDLTKYSLLGAQFNTIGSVPMAIGHAALLILLWKIGALGILGRALGAAGRMALTNYLMQSILASLVFYGYGLGMYGRLDRFQQELVVIGIWTFQLILSPIWLSRFRFGPAEWLWRSLTYWKPQPMRRGT